MKPKSKIHKRLAELSAGLPDMTDEQHRWAQEAIFKSLFVRNKSTVYCLECGHSWKDSSQMVSAIAGVTCPSCSRELSQISHYERSARHADYWVIVTSAGGFQVVRMFITYKHMKKHQPAQHHSSEVMQHWIDEKGKCVTFSKSTLGLTGYIDNWILSSDLEPRRTSYNGQLRNDIHPHAVYPKMKILPVVRRNGFKRSFHGMNPRKFFIEILSNPKAETMLKAGQISLFKRCSGSELRRFWPSVKICIRNGYIVKDAGLYFDYLGMLRTSGKDILNPKYACPADLKHEHDRLVRKINEKRRKEKLAEARERIERDNEVYIQAKQRFMDLHFSAGAIDIVPLKNVREFLIEGDELKHCLFANNYHLKKDSLILSARRNGMAVETVEVSLKELKVIQARGMSNRASKWNKLIVSTVEQNMSEIAKRL
jgi:hypothetical protein